MKLIHTALLASALLAPSAFAEDRDAQPVPFAIMVSSAVTPVSHPEFRYPHLAAQRGVDGSCDVAFAIDAAGRTQSVRVVSCTSALFENAAKAAVEQMAFAGTGERMPAVSATIRWDLNPVQQFASRD